MKKIMPFHSGSQFMDWILVNCDRCRNSMNATDDIADTCGLELKLWRAYWSDGWVDENVAKAIGVTNTPPFPYRWQCTEFKERLDE